MAGPAEADEITSPVVWRRWLSSELVRLRKVANLKQKDAARGLGCSVGRLSYLESGERAFSPDDLATLLPLYEVPKDRWPEYLDAAEAADKDGWWDAWADEELPKDLLHYVGLEDAATRIRAYHPTIIEGLLQTPEYASAIIERTWAQKAPERIARLADLRRARQAVLTRPHNPLRLHVVLDEAAIARRVGGDEVWRGQLRHLAVMAQRPHVTVQILPFSAGAHMGLYGQFAILDLPEKGGSGVVYVESLVETRLLEARNDIYQHSEAFRQLAGLALDAGQSLGLIQSMFQEHQP